MVDVPDPNALAPGPNQPVTLYYGDGSTLDTKSTAASHNVVPLDPAGPQVLLIAPRSHPIGEWIIVQALLGGDTVVLHEHARETVPSAAGTPSPLLWPAGQRAYPIGSVNRALASGADARRASAASSSGCV